MIKSMKEELTVRHEFFGTLLYSKKLRNYFKPKGTEVDLIFNEILKKRLNGNCWREGTDPSITVDLEKLGFDGEIRELSSSLEDRLMSPLELYFDFTNKCNLRCEHCYNKDALGKVTMPEPKVRDVLQQSYNMGIMRVHLAGGEPTIEPKGLMNYVETADILGLVMSMSTNGTLLTEELCRDIFSHDLFAFTVSIDAPSEGENQRIRKKGAFDSAIESVRLALRAKADLRVQTKVCIKSVCNPEMTDDYIERLVRLASDLGVDELKFYSPERSLHHEQGHYGGTYVGKYYRMIKIMQELKEKYNSLVKVSPVINPVIGGCRIGISGVRGCIGANELLTINPNGSITPCLMLHQTLGNVYVQQLPDFWNHSESLSAYRQQTISPECEGCNIYENCRGGCQVRKVVEHGKITGRDPLCPIDFDKNLQPQILESHRHDLENFRSVFNAHSL